MLEQLPIGEGWHLTFFVISLAVSYDFLFGFLEFLNFFFLPDYPLKFWAHNSIVFLKGHIVVREEPCILSNNIPQPFIEHVLRAKD